MKSLRPKKEESNLIDTHIDITIKYNSIKAYKANFVNNLRDKIK